jgi:hypothetical protein
VNEISILAQLRSVGYGHSQPFNGRKTFARGKAQFMALLKGLFLTPLQWLISVSSARCWVVDSACASHFIGGRVPRGVFHDGLHTGSGFFSMKLF